MSPNNSFVLRVSNQTLLIIFPLSRPAYDLTKTPKKINNKQHGAKHSCKAVLSERDENPNIMVAEMKEETLLTQNQLLLIAFLPPSCWSVCLRWPVVPLLLSVFHQVSDGSSIKSVLSQMSGRYSVNVFNPSGYQRVSKTELFVFLKSSSNLNCLPRPRPKFPLRTSQRTGLTGTASIWTTTF